MKIGNFEVGDYAVKEAGGKRHLIFDCRNCVYSSSLTDDKACRYHVITILSQVEADLIVLAEVYERVFNSQQTKLLKEISELLPKFELENIWGVKNLGTSGSECEKFFGLRHDLLVKVSHDLIAFDPILAYISLLSEIKTEKQKMENADYAGCSKEYLDVLLYLRKEFEKTNLISKAKEILLKLEEMPDTKQLYHSFFEAQVKPSFIGSRLMFEKAESLELLDEYSVKKSNVQIFKHPARVEKLYFLNPPEYTLPPEKYFVLSKTKEIVATYRPGKTSLSTIAKSRKYFERVYESTIFDIAKQNNIDLSKEEIKELSEIVARYTVGYGILEILLSDRNITDIYVDSPIGQKPLYIVHSEFGQCQTNILYTEDEAESLVSKLRAMSGRPFDEAHPVLDFELEDMETRIAVIGRPLAPDGIAFAFRLHKMTPWTLQQFIDKKFLSPLAAGLLSFFVDTQSTMLVTGSRGSGKTSLLSALVLEILQNSRIIVQEDSVAGDSQILVERNGKLESTTVGKVIDGVIEKHGCLNIAGKEFLQDNPENIKVFALDKKGKISLSKVSQFMRHKANKEIFEITTRTGKKLKVTSDHCLFGLKENEIQPVKSSDLRAGSFIAVPRTMSFERKGLGCISLMDYLDKIEQGFIEGTELKEFIEKNWEKIRKLAFSFGYSKSSFSAWKRNSLLPVKVFTRLDYKSLNELELKFKINKDSKAIPVVIDLNKDFLAFVGLWLADGSYDTKYGVIISSPGCEVPVLRTANQLGLKPRRHSDNFSTIISNTNFVFLLKEIFCLKGNSYTKKFPDWVFNLSKEQLSALLKGLFSGDGYTAEYEVGISLVSKQMIKDLESVLLLFGIVTRKRFVKRDKTFNCRISSLKMVKKFREFIGFIQPYKMNKLENMCLRESTHDNTDIIPFSVIEKNILNETIKDFNKYDYLTRNFSLGRQKFGRYLSESKQQMEHTLFEKFSVLLTSDVFWDEITCIKNLGKIDEFVYDFSVPEKESFVCENIVAHNTLEVPVSYMKEIGFNIQRLKTRAPIGTSKSETEVSPEDALRTALRLGDSALVLGEVRSLEARVLYEAMRVGAAGNIVLGTIHGDSAYSVWDRVVNDLNVPSTSFKATDIVVVARPIRFGGSLERKRRVVQITEVKKEWVTDPLQENGLLDLMLFDASKDKIELQEDNLKESSLFDRIHKASGLSMTEMWDSIKMNANSKAFMVELRQKLDFPELLEAENTVPATTKLMMLKQSQLEENGSVDFADVLGKWKFWYKNEFVKRLSSRRNKK
ncbi:MAG: ATPase, T2SS/T4P/T4SS family [archaeon]